MEIKNDKQLEKVLDGSISVPIYWQYRDVSQTNVIIDKESIREEFENKLTDIISAIENY